MDIRGSQTTPTSQGLMEEVLRLCLRFGVPFVTTAVGTESAGRRIAKGAQFFETGAEQEGIRQGATHLLGEYRRVNQAGARQAS